MLTAPPAKQNSNAQSLLVVCHENPWGELRGYRFAVDRSQFTVQRLIARKLSRMMRTSRKVPLVGKQNHGRQDHDSQATSQRQFLFWKMCGKECGLSRANTNILRRQLGTDACKYPQRKVLCSVTRIPRM